MKRKSTYFIGLFILLFQLFIFQEKIFAFHNSDGNYYSFIKENKSITTFPFMEGFESLAIPSGWSQEFPIGTTHWVCRTGNFNGHPFTAHSGTYNASLYKGSNGTHVTKLVTPSLDISSIIDPQLSFWHMQEVWVSDNDELRIYYKTSATGSWNLLVAYTSNITNWTKETIMLPNPSSDYYIAFEGTVKYGYGVVIDDVVVEACPIPSQPSSIVGNVAPCQGTTQSYNVTNVSGVFYNWTFPSGWTKIAGGMTNNVNVIVGNTSGNITVTPSSMCSVGPAQTLSVSTSTVPLQPGSITGESNPCQTTSQAYSVENVSGVTYNWSFPSGWIQTAGGTTNSITVTVGSGNGNITCTPSNDCGTGLARTLPVSISPVPSQPDAISGSVNPCKNTDQVYSVTNIPGLTYNWTFPTYWTQIAGGTSNSVTVRTSYTSGVVTCIPSNNCGNGTAQTLTVAPISAPDEPTGFSGSNHPCRNSTQIYSVTNVPGVTYNWTFPVGWEQIDGGTTNRVTVYVGNGSGDVICRPSNTCGYGTPYTITAISVIPPALPSAIVGLSNPCQGSSQVYSVTSINGLTYNWSFPNGWTQTAGSNTNSVTVLVGSTFGDISCSAANHCGSGLAQTLAVNPTTTPTQPSVINGVNNPCYGTTQTYSVINTDGVSYNWSFPSGWSQISGGTSNSVNVIVGSNGGNIIVVPSNTCGSGTSRTLAVTVSPGPTVNAGSDLSTCGQTQIGLNGSIGGSATSASWSTSGTGTFTPNNTTLNANYTPSIADVAAGIVYLTLTTNASGPCGSANDQTQLNIITPYTVNAGPDQTVIVNNPVHLSGVIGGGATSATWSGGIGTFSPNNTTLNATYTPAISEISVTLTLTTNNPPTPCIAVNDNMVITIDPVSVNELSDKIKFQIFPNPTEGKVVLNIEGYKGDIKINVQNTQGKLLLTNNVYINEHYFTKKLDLSGFANGIYYIQIITDNKTFVNKIIKQ